MLSDRVSDAESHDIKILTGFPGSPILEILMRKLYVIITFFKKSMILKHVNSSHFL